MHESYENKFLLFKKCNKGLDLTSYQGFFLIKFLLVSSDNLKNKYRLSGLLCSEPLSNCNIFYANLATTKKAHKPKNLNL